MIERKVAELGGIKSLYSDSYYTEERVLADRTIAPPTATLKARYDPARRAARPLREVRAAALTAAVRR